MQAKRSFSAMPNVLDLYLIPGRRQRYVIVSSPENLEALEAESSHRIRKFIAWFMRRHNRLVAWAGRALNTAYGYYLRLDDRIDPVERVLKAMAEAKSFVVYFIRIQNVKNALCSCPDSNGSTDCRS